MGPDKVYYYLMTLRCVITSFIPTIIKPLDELDDR